jgi:hypothetical protein
VAATLKQFSAHAIGIPDPNHRVLSIILDKFVADHFQGVQPGPPGNVQWAPHMLNPPFLAAWINLLPLNVIVTDPQIQTLFPANAHLHPNRSLSSSIPLHLLYDNYKHAGNF